MNERVTSEEIARADAEGQGSADPKYTQDDHPDFESLRAYHADELKPEDDDEIRKHLADCDDCSAIVLDLAGFGPEVDQDAAAELTEMDVAHAWRKVHSRLREDREASMPRPRRFPYRVLALAATVLMAFAVSVFLWQPPVQVTLKPLESARSTEGDPSCHALPRAERWKLNLEVRDEPTLSSYWLDVRPEDQQPLESLQPEPVGDEFTVVLAAADFSVGRYRLFLAGQDEGKEEPVFIEQYCIEVPDAD